MRQYSKAGRPVGAWMLVAAAVLTGAVAAAFSLAGGVGMMKQASSGT